MGLPVQCDSIQAAILAEFRFFAERQRRRDSGKPPSERREITGQIFVEKLGYTVSRGILRSVFSERNPQLFCEFMRMGPSTDPENYDTILHEPFTSTKNGVFPANMITNAQVKAILKDHRRELSAKMTVGQQYSLLHTQQKMQREEAETRRKMKADAERQKLITERGIPTPSPHTAAFQTPVAQPQTACRQRVDTVEVLNRKLICTARRLWSPSAGATPSWYRWGCPWAHRRARLRASPPCPSWCLRPPRPTSCWRGA